MVPTAVLLAALARLSGLSWPDASVLGAGLALSSTAIVLPMLAERDLLPTTSGRDSFAVLLFQDVVFVLMAALVALLAGGAAPHDAGIGSGNLGAARHCRVKPGQARQ
jgi:glutathione-regulated potassium-efflux system ancillary protein KefC